MDRSRMWWMVAHGDLNCTYYEFPPVDGGSAQSPPAGGGGGGGGPGGGGGQGGPQRRLEGFNLNEVMSSSWGFTSDDLGLS
eukprot:932743-Amphidinium_carterae.1